MNKQDFENQDTFLRAVDPFDDFQDEPVRMPVKNIKTFSKSTNFFPPSQAYKISECSTACSFSVNASVTSPSMNSSEVTLTAIREIEQKSNSEDTLEPMVQEEIQKLSTTCFYKQIEKDLHETEGKKKLQQNMENYNRMFKDQIQVHKTDVMKKKKIKKIEKTVNPCRNVVKNLGSQIASFICCQNKSFQIIQKVDPSFDEKKYQLFITYCQSYKNKLLKIADLRDFWIGDEEHKEYHKIIRILSRYFLQNSAIPMILLSKKIKNKIVHLGIRRNLIEKLKDPSNFYSLN